MPIFIAKAFETPRTQLSPQDLGLFVLFQIAESSASDEIANNYHTGR